MSVRQYIGARYIPLFADPIDWDIDTNYEPLTVVMNEGTSYVSKQYVPSGIQITNENYWIAWADYNAQIEAYRAEVAQYNGRIEALENGLPVTDYSSENTVSDAIADLGALLPTSDFASDNTVKDTIDNLGALLPTTEFDSTNTVDERFNSVEALLPANAFDSTNTIDARFDTIEANNWVTENRIAPNAVTNSKLANGSVSNAKLSRDALNFSNKKILVIGDSLTMGNEATKYWPAFMHDLYGCTTYNFAVSGQGFVNNASGTFASQVTAAAADSSFNNADITDVVVLGGYNDYAYTDAVIDSAVRDLVSSIKSNFPNAHIYVGAMLKGIYPLDYAIGGASENQSRSLKISVIEYGASVSGATIIEAPWTWCMGETGFNVDNIHVNNDGQRYIATRVYQAMTGTKTVPYKRTRITTSPNANLSEYFVEFYTAGEMVNMWGHIKSSAAVSGTVVEIPKWAYSSRIGNTNKEVSSSDNNNTTDCTLVSSGNVVSAYGINAANIDVWFNASWPFGI